jgi:surface polysaccharide O-acyltransferase-like enzyme
MNHYGKNAAMIFRVVGCCVMIYSLMAVVYNVIYEILITNEQTPRGFVAANILSSIFYFVVGLILYAFSKPLAALITRKLRED